jgi:hypothetical protein
MNAGTPGTLMLRGSDAHRLYRPSCPHPSGKNLF